MIELEWSKGGKGKQTYKGAYPIISIGRDRENDIVIDDHKISAHHAAIIENEKGNYFIRDLGSLNGIIVNDDHCFKSMLFVGSIIKLSEFIIKIKKISKSIDEQDDCPEEILLGSQIETPVFEVAKDYQESPDFRRTTISFKRISTEYKIISSIIAELNKMNNVDSVFGHLLKEMGDTLMKAKCGYLALFDPNKKLLVRKRLRLQKGLLPELPTNYVETSLKEGKSIFFQLKSQVNAALVPIKDTKGIIGIIYLYDIPGDHLIEEKISSLAHLIDEIEFKKILSIGRDPKKNPTDSKENFKWKEKFVGNRKSESLSEVFQQIEELSLTDKPIVILGETGTGKTDLARKIHELSHRRDKIFVKVDLNTINETLVESEMFGTVKGGFTGSVLDRPGYFEHANGGTIFLDEIGNLSLNVQNKLLQPLDDHPIIRRIGSVKEIPVNVRVIAATNKDIEVLVKEGKFKEDLYRRLGIGLTSIELPTLTERKKEIPLLTNFFIDEFGEGRSVEGISRMALKPLIDYKWQGNIGVLRSVIMQALILADSEGRKVISISDLPGTLNKRTKSVDGNTNINHLLTLDELEKEHIVRVLKMAEGNKTQAATLLGITRPTLNAKLVKYEIQET